MSDAVMPRIDATTGADASLQVLLWRQSLANGPRVPRVQDIEAWIGHLDGTGAAGVLLDRCVAVLRGGGGTLLSDGVPERWTVEVALDELRGLAGRLGGTMTLTASSPRWSGTPDNPAGIAPDRDLVMPADLVALANGILTAMAASGAAADQRLVASLETLCDLCRRLSTIDYRAFRHAPLSTLVTAIALVALMDFALRTRDLWASPYGSAALMRAAASLSSTGLGVYGDRVGQIARSSADVYDLARIAIGASAGAPADAREAWICFLSRSCRKDLLIEIIDDLGDVAASHPLAAILRQASDRIEVDIGLLWRIRDAALDIGDLPLAIRAQRVVADARDQDGGEVLILGSLYATAGEIAAAAATFRELMARQWPGAEERLQALKTDTFGPYRIDRGFTSPADRQATRLHRRGEPGRYPRTRGNRIDAVDVG